MITIDININKEMLGEAEIILEAVGLTKEVAFEIFIRNIIKTKGFPIDLKQKEVISEPTIKNKRNIVKINEKMIQTVWDKFLVLNSGRSSVIELSDEIELESGMSKGSAFIYLVILSNMLLGLKNTRNMKIQDFKFFLTKIKEELGQEIFMKSLNSLKDSIPYWENKNPLFSVTIRDLIDSYQV
jgi:antitoxin component of RelBE/YafQ-DinJ toxin-antitoxin module